MLTKNFKKNEFNCKCGCEMPEDVEHNVGVLARQLQKLRFLTGGPVDVVSGFRCPEYNAKVGGVTKSQHLKGKAADIVCSDEDGRRIPHDEIVSILKGLIKTDEIFQGGIGQYDTFSHYDIRGTKARWDKRRKKND